MRAVNIKAIGVAGVSAMIAIAAHGQLSAVPPGSASKSEAVDDAEGNLHVPATYRRAFQYVGSWAIAADQGHGSKEFHIVYASPGAIDAYRRDGHFPNDTVLVKEVYEAATAQRTTGTVNRADALKGWFVMAKDNNARHPR